MRYKCPLCGSALSPSHYHRVVKAQRATRGELDKLKREAKAAEAAAAASRKREQQARAKMKAAAEAARREAVLSERRKSAVRDKRLLARIRKLEEEKTMLQKHTSPQEMGLADESVLVKKLRDEFPEDDIQHVGKGGDVLQYVYLGKDPAGCIVYECKRTDRIASSHVAQTCMAKKTRGAEYAILVTTGTRRRFSGLDQEQNIFIVSPSGVLTLARLCRESLLMMKRQRLDAFAKAAAAKRLMEFITSPACRTLLEDAISQTEKAHAALIKEMRQHATDWRIRNEIYQTIQCDVTHIRTNIGRILANQEILKLERPPLRPLSLPVK